MYEINLMIHDWWQKKTQTIGQVVQSVTSICPMFSTGSQRHHERALEIRSDTYRNRRPFPPQMAPGFPNEAN